MKPRRLTRLAGLRWILLAAVALPTALAVPTARGGQNEAGENDAPPDDRAADVQDLVLLGALRPLHVRLHIVVDKQPFRKLWRERIETAFGESDADGDGRITADQAAQLVASLSGPGGGQASGTGADVARPWTVDGDKGVSLSAVLAHLEKVAPPLSVREEPGVSGTAIFAVLDADGDRRLSLAELRNAQRLLSRRDFNDDDAIAADELIEDPRAHVRQESTSDGEPNSKSVGAAGSVVVLAADTTNQIIASNLLARYDRNRNGRLSVKGPEVEVGLESSVLDTLSPDSEGGVSGEELALLCRQHIDVEAPLALGAGGTAGRSAARMSNNGFKIRKRLTGDLKIEGAGVELDLRRNNRNPLRNSGRETALADYDVDGNGYLDEAESRQAPLIADAFAQMDSDHDGKVVKAEFESYMRRQSQAAGARLVLRVTDRGQDLFDLLDATPDNQLSAREIMTAAKLLDIADRNGDGYLGGDEIAQRLEWELARGTAELADNLRLPARAAPRGSAMADQTSGPKWFAAMDRNQDGDLSAREFLGPPDVFQRLDANHDGLIDASEAAAVK